MSGTTSSLRFPGQLNSDLRKLAVNLIPFPRMHFFITSHSPLDSIKNKNFRSHTVAELTQQIFDSKNLMADCNIQNGRFLTASAVYRGKISTKEVEDHSYKLQNKRSDQFVEWIPNGIKTSVVNTPPAGEECSATFIGNHTSIKTVFQRVAKQFSIMFKRKAFLHWFTGEGMEEMEFTECESNVLDLMAEYEQHQENNSSFSESQSNTSVKDVSNIVEKDTF